MPDYDMPDKMFHRPEETPEQKAKRIGVPLIPKNSRPYIVPMDDPNRTVSVCGECGLEIKQVMGYCCPKANCPTGLGSSLATTRTTVE
jgi:hypothetical protein